MTDQIPSSGIIYELLTRQIITNEQAEQALSKSKGDISPVRVLIEERAVTEHKVYETVATAAGMRFIDPTDLIVDPSASDRLTGDRARRLKALPYGWENESLLVAVADPTNVNMLDDLRQLTGAKPALVLAPPSALERKIAQNYRAESEMDDISGSLGDDSLSEEETEFTIGGEDLPIIRYVNLLIQQAIIDRASDVHIEPTDTTVQVRYRIDGVLHEQADTSKAVLNAVVSRIKIMANLDIAEKRVPQDGRISLTIEGRKVDLRVSTLPTVYGEKIVMRILDNEATPLNIRDIGLTEANQEIYLRNAKKPHGLILATGPTGSGKTTTLYSTINSVRSPQVNIITVEDPVEFRLPGLNQIQIHPKAGLTFSTALRSILRSDPDIILVGEIRDAETAKIAVEASLTGHLVLTTLHTNDAASAVTRLVEMGIEPYLVAQAISLVVAQRLVRQLCADCAEDYQPNIEDLHAIHFPLPEDGSVPTLKKAVGCEKCARTGYRGRLALHELLEVTEDIEKLIVDGKYNSDIRRFAQEHAGMKTVREDGWVKVLAGLTTIDEVLRVSV